jgi:hypothetical protein
MLPLIYHLETRGRFVCMMFFRAESVNAAVARGDQALATRKLDLWSAAVIRAHTCDGPGQNTSLSTLYSAHKSLPGPLHPYATSPSTTSASCTS